MPAHAHSRSLRCPAAALTGLLWLGSLLLPSLALGQDEEGARAAFARGVDAADAGRWEVARDAFEEAYRLWPRPTILLNLAGARVQTGHLVSGADAYRAILSEAGAPKPIRMAAHDALLALEVRIPRLELRILDMTDADEITLDERPIEAGPQMQPLELEPGRHTVRVSRGGEELRVEEFRLAERERLRLDLRLPRARTGSISLVPDTSAGTAGADGEDREEVWESPIFWTIVGVVVGGAVALGVGLSLSDESPFAGNLMPGSIEIR